MRGAGDDSSRQAGITTQTKAAARGVNAELSGRQGNASKQYEQDTGSHWVFVNSKKNGFENEVHGFGFYCFLLSITV